MNFRSYFLLTLAVFATSLLQSCDDYLEVNLQDQMTLTEVFSKRVTTERYLAHIYSYLPYEYDYIGTNKDSWGHRGGDGNVVPRSDEALFSWYQWMPFLQFFKASYGPTNWEYNKWELYYQGINQATVFMNNVDACGEISSETRAIMKAEARFLRAYCYFLLFRQYGPVFLWANKINDNHWEALTPDPTIDPLTIDRSSVDDNVNFMVYEMDEAIKVLPLTIADADKWAGRLTKGAAMAAKARLLLYAARPLFNGCDLYKGIKDHNGNPLFPQQTSMEKWERAAKAAKAVIDMPQYRLAKDDEVTGTDMEKAIANYQKIYNTPWNEECIWGAFAQDILSYNEGSSFFFRVRCQPPKVCKIGYGGFAPSLKMVDTYPMAASGRFPVIGYNEGNPIVDPESGYEATGFTDNWRHPIEGPKFGGIKVHNSCKGRDARYYASVFANGFWWINSYIAGGKRVVTFHKNGSSPYVESGDCIKSGFLWRRFLDPSLNTENGSWGYLFWNYYRLGEVYLNYAEACIELGRVEEALEYINKIRERVGLNKLEEAYSPAELSSKEKLRELYAKERMCEMAWECDRWYYATQWMIAEKEFQGPDYTLNLLASSYESSWDRTTQVWAGGLRKFEPRMYLFPINQVQLNESRNLTQNYGW